MTKKILIDLELMAENEEEVYAGYNIVQMPVN